VLVALFPFKIKKANHMSQHSAMTRRLRRAGAGWSWRVALSLLGAGALAGAAAAQTVATYHGADDRSGLYITPDLSWGKAPHVHMDEGFVGTISGDVYAQPLYWLPPDASSGRIIVATESNIVYALDALTGRVVWKRALGAPVSASALPCGNIDPMGITGTPVIDPASGTLYLDAMISAQGGPRHRIFALSLANGTVLQGWPVGLDVGMTALGKGFDSETQGQRSALAIANGYVYVNFGALAGDCSTYHGTIVELALGQPKITAAWKTRAHGGGIWAWGGIANDGQSLFVATGNTMGTSTWLDGEAVFRLQPGLVHSTAKADYFTPRNWLDLDNEDNDLGGTGPLPVDVPVGDGTTVPRLLALGKDGNAYLLDRSNLGGLGGALAITQVSSTSIITAAARFPTPTEAMVAFLASPSDCPSGQSGNVAVLSITNTNTPIRTKWCAGIIGNGAPIVTTTDGQHSPIVWLAGGNEIYAFRGTDGHPLYVGPGLNGLHTNTTIVPAQGHLYVAGDNQVYAFTY
jgi:outer membrane protein assembly factor BamB